MNLRVIEKVLTIALGVLLIFSATTSASPIASNATIGIVYTEPDPVINTIIAGFEETVHRAYPRVRFVEHNAEGRPEEYGTAVLATISSNPTIIAPITTPITKIVVSQDRGRIPIVFMGVTDPVGAGVARTIQKPAIATGSSDLCPFAELLHLARQLLPNAHVLGLPYNPLDEPAVFGRSQIMAQARRYGFSVVDQQVTSASELGTEVAGLATRSDAVIIAADNLMMENPSLVASAAANEGKPTFACDADSVQAGAVAGVSVDYHEVGALAGERAVEVLRGRQPGSLPIAVLRSGGLAINMEAACRSRVRIPKRLIAEAAHIFRRGFRCPT